MEAELMQFTGLLDKNDKDIYEGDILEWSVWPDEEGNAKRIRDSIEFRHGAFATSQRYQLLATLEPHRTLEVVGNIYENPDLVPSE